MKRRKRSSVEQRWEQARQAQGDAAGIRLLRSLLGDTSHDPSREVTLGPAHDPWSGPQERDPGPTLGEYAARRLEVLGASMEKRGKRKRR